jgi:putative protease
VQWIETPKGLETRLGPVLVDRVGEGEDAGYPTLCKGRYEVGGDTYYAIEEPTSLNTLDLLPQLAAAGVSAIKLEGRQRSLAYVRQVTGVWRAAIDACRRDPAGYRPRTEWMQTLGKVSEGQQTTLGAYARVWQ